MTAARRWSRMAAAKRDAVRCSGTLAKQAISAGDRVNVDASQGSRCWFPPKRRRFGSGRSAGRHPADIGGLDEQIERIRDAVQMPFQHRELFERYDLRPETVERRARCCTVLQATARH